MKTSSSSVWCLMVVLHIIILFGMISSSLGSMQQVPAMFVFGDSLIDPGNNNNYKTIAKANNFPNGIDFPYGITGRFCNGATVADHLGYLLGIEFIPACNDPRTTGSNLLRGVNFASSSAGILNDTGAKIGQNLPMSRQVELFGEKILPELKSLMENSNGEESATNTFEHFVAKSLIFSSLGNNDLLNHYLGRFANPLNKPIPPQFWDSVLIAYSDQLKKLYSYGARKFLVTGLGPLGCVPYVIASFGQDPNQCYEHHNEIAVQYSLKIKAMVQQLNQDLPGAYVLYWNVYPLIRQIIDNPSQYGFKYSHCACCGAGPSNALFFCVPGSILCPDRSEFVFWDWFHPSDATNKISAKQAYDGIIQSTYPMNLKQLLQL
ncbi:GDSL esterase/lipase [Thalictrum thalictroides]|uniref:GDSL esterase/lipase n=1 Tax=Thalictrum thalictroides TaxID=46969 RepID=A0A7J6V7R8_THATH|nr:GDSL esterase/lipase [Thalictrum thalictroides]